MIPNPYAPPSAEVADPEFTHLSPPSSVRSACLLIAAALALSIITLLPGIRLPPPDEQPVPLLLTFGVLVVFGGLTVWFAVKVFRGKNWARWAMLIYLMLGWVLVGMELNTELARAPLSAIIDSICIIMELVACWLLFFGTGAQWFSGLSMQHQAHSSGP